MVHRLLLMAFPWQRPNERLNGRTPAFLHALPSNTSNGDVDLYLPRNARRFNNTDVIEWDQLDVTLGES